MNTKLTRNCTLTCIFLILMCICLCLNTENAYAGTVDDIDYTVKYVEQGKESKVLAEKIVREYKSGDVVTEYAPAIEGYSLMNNNKQEIQVGSVKEIVFYYEQLSFSNCASLIAESNSENTIMPRSSEIPVSTWNVEKKGVYNMGCDVNIQLMYSNYWFTGSERYQISVTNKRNAKLNVSARGWIRNYGEITINSAITMSFTITLDDASDKFYVRAKSGDTYIDMTGYVRGIGL